MKRFEYKVINLTFHWEEYRLLRECDKRCDLQYNLDALGEEGWELMECHNYQNDRYTCILKRRKRLWR